MHDLEFGFTPGVHAALVCILYLMTCFLLAPMTRYSTCSHALCSLPFWALSCCNTGKIPYLLKSACKAAKLHGNILPDSRTLQRCAAQVSTILNSENFQRVNSFAGSFLRVLSERSVQTDLTQCKYFIKM